MKITIKPFVYAMYILRRRAKDNHKEAFSNAVFFTAIILSLLAIPLLALMERMSFFSVKWVHNIVEFSGEEILIGALILMIWIGLKVRMKSMSEKELYEQIEFYALTKKHPNMVVFSPLFFLLIIMFLYLILL